MCALIDSMMAASTSGSCSNISDSRTLLLVNFFRSSFTIFLLSFSTFFTLGKNSLATVNPAMVSLIRRLAWEIHSCSPRFCREWHLVSNLVVRRVTNRRRWSLASVCSAASGEADLSLRSILNGGFSLTGFPFSAVSSQMESSAASVIVTAFWFSFSRIISALRSDNNEESGILHIGWNTKDVTKEWHHSTFDERNVMTSQNDTFQGAAHASFCSYSLHSFFPKKRLSR